MQIIVEKIDSLSPVKFTFEQALKSPGLYRNDIVGKKYLIWVPVPDIAFLTNTDCPDKLYQINNSQWKSCSVNSAKDVQLTIKVN